MIKPTQMLHFEDYLENLHGIRDMQFIKLSETVPFNFEQIGKTVSLKSVSVLIFLKYLTYKASKQWKSAMFLKNE